MSSTLSTAHRRDFCRALYLQPSDAKFLYADLAFSLSIPHLTPFDNKCGRTDNDAFGFETRETRETIAKSRIALITTTLMPVVSLVPLVSFVPLVLKLHTLFYIPRAKRTTLFSFHLLLFTLVVNLAL